MAVYPVILAGGGGKRLWPLSNPQEPKPFLRFDGRPTLFQATVQRVLHWAKPQHLRVVCGNDHAALVRRDLHHLNLESQNQVTIEPCGRNTGPAVLLQALLLLKQDPEAVMVVLPADHVIEPASAFQAIMEHAVAEVADKMMLLGVVPIRPETGYGYIQTIRKGEIGEVVPVKRFVEKPDAATAETYLAQGDFLWNAGIFVFRAATISEEFRKYQPVIYAQVAAFVEGDVAAFEKAPNLSIDVAVMEPSQRTAVIPVDFAWNDVGHWPSAATLFKQDVAGNSVLGEGTALDCEDCLVVGDDARVAGFGLKNMVVVAARNQVLVAPKERCSELKTLVDHLGPAATGNTIHRPWGSFCVLDETPGALTKRIDILPKSRTSLQKHHHRNEFWVVTAGRLKVRRNEEVYYLEPGQSTVIPIGAIHRLENEGDIPVSLIEVQMGEVLSEEDIVRFEDDYGRQIEDPSSVAR